MKKNEQRISVATVLLTLMLAFVFSFAGVMPQSSIKAEAKGNEKMSIYIATREIFINPDGYIYWEYGDHNKMYLVKKGRVVKNQKARLKKAGITYNKKKNTLTIKNLVQPELFLYCENVGTDFKMNFEGSNEIGRIEVDTAGYGAKAGASNVTIGGKGILVVNPKRMGTQDILGLEAAGKDADGSTYRGIYVFGHKDKTKLTIKKSIDLTCYGNIQVVVQDSKISNPKSYAKKLLVLKGNKIRIKAKKYHNAGGDDGDYDQLDIYTTGDVYRSR